MRDELNTKIMKAKDEVGLKAMISQRANPWNVIGKKLHIASLFYFISSKMLLTFCICSLESIRLS